MSDEEELAANESGCFRHRFSGLYKIFNRGDFGIRVEWVFIHNGPCECEGQTMDQCVEPGDPDA